MTRRKHLAQRKPGGRILVKKAEPVLPSPTETRRLLDAVNAGLRDPTWGTRVGVLLERGQINASEYNAGVHWAALASDYSGASLSPKAPRTAKLAADGGSPPDPDSAAGRKEALRQARLAASYVEAYALLERMGGPVRRAVVETCEYGLHPVGVAGFQALRRGLQGLAHFWGSK